MSLSHEALLATARASGTLATARGMRFEVRVESGLLVFTPASTGIPRWTSPAVTDAVIARFSQTGSLRPVDYQDMTHNASYYVALIKATTGNVGR